MSKFHIGDKVKIVKYGALHWINKHDEYNKLHPPTENIIWEDENTWYCDMRPDLVGQIGIINAVPESHISSSPYQYSIDKIGAWYTDNQLELIARNPNIV
jgi:hypothetical protein